MQIAIVEDDRSVAAQLGYALTIEGDNCHLFGDAESFLRALPTESFDVCIIDLMLPGMDGKSLLRTLRERTQWVPALVLTMHDSALEVVQALEAGADDFLVKPVRAGELRARLKALVRRSAPVDTSGEVWAYDRFEFNLKTLEVRDTGQTVALTQKEFQLAMLFLRNVGKPISRRHICESVWGHNPEVLSRTMDTHVSRVRSKLGLRPEGGFLLAPVYGYGYRLEDLKVIQHVDPPGLSA